jgi:uncharacterized membrane protein (UPF0127 family)
MMKYKTIGMIPVIGFLLLTPYSCKDKGSDGTGTTSGPILSPPLESFSTEVVEIGGEKFTLELAFTEEDRRQGLMYRKELPADRGMIFIFARSLRSPFHMQNCLIDLDILFLKEDGAIVHITTMKAPPPGELSEVYYCRSFYQYAIELPADTAQRLGLQVGDKIQLPRRIRDIIPDPN